MFSLFDGDSRELLVLAVAAAVLLTQDQDQDQIGRMAAFFNLMGDAMALLALQPDRFSSCRSLCSSVATQPNATVELDKCGQNYPPK